MNNNSAIQKKSTTKLVYCAMLIGLSAVGALIKFPGTTIALDSMPAYFAALFLGAPLGALVAGIGHFLTALTSGFPLTLPMHLIIGLEMAIFVYIFGVTVKKIKPIIGIILAILLNGPVSALLAVPISEVLGLPLSGWALFSVVIIPLVLGSIVNIIFAFVIYKILNKE